VSREIYPQKGTKTKTTKWDFSFAPFVPFVANQYCQLTFTKPVPLVGTV
jgi:hypothetical protein